MGNYNDTQNLPVLSWPFGDLPVNEEALTDRKQEELAESAEERLNKDEELAHSAEKGYVQTGQAFQWD